MNLPYTKLTREENKRIQGLTGKTYDLEFYKLVDNLYPCFDCMYETMVDEYYMVLDEIWEKAVGDEKLDFLCVSCLEKRIGRKLISVDFTKAPVNDTGHPYFNIRSRRLIERMRNENAVPEQ